MIKAPAVIDFLIPGLRKASTEAEKRKVIAEEFVAVFLRELVKVMNDNAEGLFGKGFASDVYRTLFEIELSRALARDSALKDALMKEFSLKDIIKERAGGGSEIKDFSVMSDKGSEGYRPSGIKSMRKEEDHED
ncbi:MAG: hypothetical protein D6778_02570 [Nitrospirae bacterium]|nr:MAG: hypothetical protein D6778_02570 [Nitrospirota bacterium]